MLAQAQNADTRLTRRDIDMLLDRLQTANPESAQVAGTTDDEFRQKFAALARKKWANAAGRIISTRPKPCCFIPFQ